MRTELISLLCCPSCSSGLEADGEVIGGGIETGWLHCSACQRRFEIRNGIPRFVDKDNYAENFGVQWQMFRRTQLDSHSGTTISRDRFERYTGFSDDEIAGRFVLDAGCGAGRFAEIALSKGARLVAIDYSEAIDAARDNLRGKGEVDFIQADINALPLRKNAFDLVYCLGVIQHTPDPAATFRSLATMVAPGGRLSLDVYPHLAVNRLLPKYWIRPITRRLAPKAALRLVKTLFPILFPVSVALGRIPVAGRYLRHLVPVANYRGILPLDGKQNREWSYLDTFDMWAPAYDRPQSVAAVSSWFEKAGFDEIEVLRMGFTVGRGRKAAHNQPMAN